MAIHDVAASEAGGAEKTKAQCQSGGDQGLRHGWFPHSRQQLLTRRTMPTGWACGAEVLQCSISQQRPFLQGACLETAPLIFTAASSAPTGTGIKTRLATLPRPCGGRCCGIEDHPRGPSADQSKARTS